MKCCKNCKLLRECRVQCIPNDWQADFHCNKWEAEGDKDCKLYKEFKKEFDKQSEPWPDFLIGWYKQKIKESLLQDLPFQMDGK